MTVYKINVKNENKKCNYRIVTVSNRHAWKRGITCSNQNHGQ